MRRLGSVELLKIARDALLDVRHAPLHLARVVAVVYCLELAAVNRDAGLRQQAHRETGDAFLHRLGPSAGAAPQKVRPRPLIPETDHRPFQGTHVAADQSATSRLSSRPDVEGPPPGVRIVERLAKS
jgi:hypothetical protein